MHTLTRSETLLPLVGDKAKLQHYAATTPIVDMVRFSPAQLDAEALINLLRPRPCACIPSPSQAEVENEVHVTVGVVRYDGRPRPCRWCLQLPRGSWKKRVKSAYLSNITTTSACQPIRNPGDHDWPGTGIAPSRAFMQQRAADEAPGKTGYSLATHTYGRFPPVEWQRYVKEGVLTRIDLARSRDQKKKNLRTRQTARTGRRAVALDQ